MNERLLRLLLCLVLMFFGGIAAAAPQTATVYRNPPGPRIPDPFVLQASDGRYYAYGTTGFRAWSSSDLVNWKAEGKVYGTSANSWGLGSFWAPEVVEYAGKYYLYYTADLVGDSKRIGVAVSDKPTGPFIDPYPRPLLDPGYGSIDPHVFIDDDGRKYLYYSRAMSENEVSPGRFESYIYVIELGDDMISVKGEPVLLTRPEQPWELQSGPRSYWNEGVAVLKRNGVYYLMWSANSYAGRRYAVGFATSDSPMGPFTKWPDNPVLSADVWGQALSGPGHNSVTRSPDGSEWIIAYHTHVDPAQGGGPRQINIDRMGFRADGSIYVNGPSLTPQPMPSGVTPWRNIAPEATVTASSVKAGHRLSAVIDGEIGFDPRFARYDWVSAEESRGAWVQLSWERERQIDTLFIYDSALDTRKIKKGRVIFSDGTVTQVDFPPEPGAAAIVAAPAAGIAWVRFEVEEMVNKDAIAGLSEIIVMGSPIGEALLDGVWISSPRPGATMNESTPVVVQGVLPSEVAWSVLLDDSPIYEGDSLPANLHFDPAALAPGEHLVQVGAHDTAGRASIISSAFIVEHLRIASPVDGAYIQGLYPIAAHVALPADSIERVAVSIAGTPEEGPAVDKLLFTGSKWPADLTLDTLHYRDGVYKLRFELWTKAGVHSTVERSVTIDNWITLSDPLLPPMASGWFGTVSRDLTKDRSAGWVYATDNPADFYGDADRLVRQTRTNEYLVWQQPKLHDFTIELFTQEPGQVEQVLRISVSADGQSWTPVPYKARTVGEAPAVWRQVELSGSVPEDLRAGYLRIELVAEEGASAQGGGKGSDLQIGAVTLVGRMW